MDEPWRHERVTLRGGLGMHLARAGSGPPMVLLHGFPECWYSWRHQLRALSDRHACVAPDLRGYGETDAPSGVANYTIEKLAGDVADLIAALGRERAIVVGHDWGGVIAWATALMRPEIVERLIVLNCPHPRKYLATIRRDPRQMLRSWYILFFQIPWLPEALLRMRKAALVGRMIRDSAYVKEAFSDDDLAHLREAFKNPYAATAAINYYRALMRRELWRPPPDHWTRRTIAAPTMLIWGEHDVALRKELTFGMEGLFTGPFRLEYIPDAGHWVQQERPERVNELIRTFLAETEAQS